MSTFKRIVALLLVCVFVGMALVACGKKDETDKEDEKDSQDASDVKQTEKQTTIYGEPTFEGVVPVTDLDFEGEEISILHRDAEIINREWHKDSTEDELDEAVAMRNAAVEETLNVEVTYERVTFPSYDQGANNFNTLVYQDVTQGFHYYDIAAHFAYAGAYPIIRDCNANLLDDNLFPYFDFSLPCWNQTIVKNTTINNRLHYIAGDINISLFDETMVIWYNKTLYDEKKEEVDPEHMQEFALDGLWTYSELYRWASRLYEDSNGTSGKQADDTYGYGTPKRGSGYPCPGDSIPHAWDLEFLIENNDGTHSYNIIGNDKAEDALTKFRNLFDADGTCEQAGVSNFAAGHYVFFASKIYPGKDGNMMIREMEDTYGLLPMPKYNVEQEQYGTTATDGYSLMTVLDHSKSTVETKGEAVSAYLQLATEESYTSVRGYYFNRIIKPKYFGTDDSEGTVSNSIALFDIIVANVEFTFWNIYSAQLNDIAWLWRDTVGKSGTLESEFSAHEEAYNTAIKETDAWLGLITVD
jgi:hypothetical protein